MRKTLVVLAAGMASRYGGNKQLAPVGPNGEALLDYAIHDALQVGFTGVCLVIREMLEPEFREHVERVVGDGVRVDFAYQDINDYPDQLVSHSGRSKPWGTAHAVLAARNVVKDPLVVINADDFYGAGAYELLSKHLDSSESSSIAEFAMAGFTLNETLSPFGGVSRGICECDDEGYLESLVEVKKIAEENGETYGFTVAGEKYTLNGNEIVSMNIWGLTPTVFPALEKQFAEFREEYDQDIDAEFLLSSALNEQIAMGQTRLKVFHTSDKWFGMTFNEDKAIAEQAISSLIERGKYPRDLTSWFRTR